METTEVNGIPVSGRCHYCSGETRADRVQMAVWRSRDHELVIIEDVPAWVCESCMEQFYDDETRYRIERLQRTGFPLDKAVRVIQVPVFSLDSDVSVDRGELSSE